MPNFFNKYPYTDFHELNLDFVLKTVKELIEAFNSFVAANSLTFADPLQWSLTNEYSKNTIVLDSYGNAYLSINIVPAGIDIHDNDYWLEIFNFSDYVMTANKNLSDHFIELTDVSPIALNTNDWLLYDNVLYEVTTPINIGDVLVVDGNIRKFTVEDFIKNFMTVTDQHIEQYKTYILNQVNNTVNDLQTQLNTAISGVTVDSEVINARVGYDSTVYTTLHDAIVNQIIRIREQISPANGLITTAAALNGYGGVAYTTPQTALSVVKGMVLTASFNITSVSFDMIRIVHGVSGVYSSYLQITPMSWAVYTDGSLAQILDSSLSPYVPEYMRIMIIYKSEYLADIVISTPSDTKTFNDVPWKGSGMYTAFIRVDNGDLSNVSFGRSLTDANKDIIVLGDSYENPHPYNWVYLYNQYFNNIMFCGFGGANAGDMKTNFLSLCYLHLIRPKYAVFAAGMNNGSDPDNTTPRSDWLTEVNDFLSTCSTYNITPVFATIPTVPTILNEGKNYWIRNSGYRFVDVAAAVGADSAGVWYTQMLGLDNIHPSARGSFAIFNEYIRSIPEATLSK